ncbi:type II toxin-antitoxin system VapC family toxin [Candidatus Woesearchaeota archaeon]|nr:type II toxin-antitoxin system VapC family toxin [Candidatus Woesearchaeota archaeon]
MTALLDSWCWIEYFNGTDAGKKIAEYIDSDKSLFISVINLVEVYRYALSKKSEKDADMIVSMMMSRCFILPVEAKTALNAAKLNWEKKWGLGDSLIYITAKVHNVQLVSGDSHFKNQENIIYIEK